MSPFGFGDEPLARRNILLFAVIDPATGRRTESRCALLSLVAGLEWRF
ncbi:MAG: hypothetical protein IPK72_24090 [Candidatus Eisenbacteria bacterium]|nr:hypothetical protein [Candidatus Eisenbacteria bacterium]